MAIVGSAEIIIRADTSLFKKEIEAALNDVKKDIGKIGKDIGKGLSDGIKKGSGGKDAGLFDNLVKGSDLAKKSFDGLIRKSYYLGPALSGAASAASDLVSGLFAVGSAVGAAAPALVVLPGILTAFAQAAITAKVAFGGVMKGISAITNQKTGTTTDTGQGAATQRAIEDARKRLAKVYQSTAEQMAAANDKVRKAQVALNQAYKDGTESLQQLGFDAEDAALAQSRAAIELERARESLLRTQDVPVDSRARREAELAFKEAELNYRQAKDKSSDLAKAQEYAARTGIEGTKEVISAKQDLNQAEADRAKQERDNAQDIASAQLALQRALEDAAKNANKSSSETKDLLKDLSKEAREFVLHMAELRPKFLALRTAAGKNLFGPLTEAMDNLVNNLFPTLKPILTAMGGVVGNIAKQFSFMLTKATNLEIFKKVFGGTNIQVMKDLGSAFVSIAEAMLFILDAASPLITTFSKWIKTKTQAFNAAVKLKHATGELTDTFNESGRVAGVIGGVLGKTGGALFALGKTAKGAGEKIIVAFGGAMDKLKLFSETNTKELETKFDRIADNVIAIGRFVGLVAKAFFELGGNKGVKDFFKAIEPIPGIFAGIAQNLTGTGGLFGEFLVKISTLIAKFTETGGIQNFFAVLNKALEVVNKIFSNELVLKIFGALAALNGFILGFGVLRSVGSFAIKILIGKLSALGGAMALLTPTGLGKKFTALGDSAFNAAGKLEKFNTTSKNSPGGFKALTTGLGNLRAGFALLGAQIWIAMAPLLPWIALGAAVAAIFILMWKNSKILRDSIGTLVNALGGAFGDALETINKAIHDVMPQFNNINDVFKKMGDFVGKYIVPIFQVILVVAIKNIGNVIALVIRVLKAFWTMFTDPIAGIKQLLGAFGTFFKDTLLGTFKSAQDALGKIPLFKSIMDGAKAAFNSVAKFWNNTIGSIDFNVPDWIPGIGGKGFMFPKLPLLADGGVVRATPGGVHAIIGEAGRNERVEPLDANGLSTRDKAIILELAGRMGGSSGSNQTFVINPSPGMDEREIANLVSRRLAFMQRGA
jgi:hypothetical protein